MAVNWSIGTATVPANGSPNAGQTVQTVTSWKGQVSLQSITDGSSNTFPIGESTSGPRRVCTNEDRSVFDGNRNCYVRTAGYDGLGVKYLIPNPPTAMTLYPLVLTNDTGGSTKRPSAATTTADSRAWFVFCDGSVHLVNVTVDPYVLTYLGCTRGWSGFL